MNRVIERSIAATGVLFTDELRASDLLVSFHVLSAGSGNTVLAEISNDGANWIAVNAATFGYAPAAVSNILTQTASVLPIVARYIRLRCSAYGSGTITIMTALGDGWPSNSFAGAPSLPLDAISTAAYAAWSTRKLRSAYSGPAISGFDGSVSTDVGFSGNDLNTTSLAAIGSTVSFNKWYDQSGNANDFVYQSLTRPEIRSAGSNQLINGKCSWNLTANSRKITAGTGNVTTCRTIVAAVTCTSLAAVNTMLGGDTNLGPWQTRWEADGSLGAARQSQAYIGASTPGQVVLNTPSIFVWQYNSANGAYAYQNQNTNVGSGTNVQGLVSAPLLLGAPNNNGNFAAELLVGRVGEIFVFDTAGPMNSSDLTTLINDMKTYWGI